MKDVEDEEENLTIAVKSKHTKNKEIYCSTWTLVANTGDDSDDKIHNCYTNSEMIYK